MNEKTFTGAERQRYQSLKSIAQLNDKATKVWADALIEIDQNEFWRIDKAESMHAWAVQHCPQSYTKIISVLKRLQERSNERLIEHTTGERVIRNSHKSKRQSLGVSPIIDVPSNTTSTYTPLVIPKVVPEDDIGTMIPEPALPIWNRRDEIKTLLSDLKRIRSQIMDRKKEGDQLYTGINQNCLDKLSLTINEIKSSVPEVVCGSCEGRAKDGCGACSHTRFQSKHDYERLTPEEDIKLRKAAIELRRKHAAARLSTTVPRLHP